MPAPMQLLKGSKIVKSTEVCGLHIKNAVTSIRILSLLMTIPFIACALLFDSFSPGMGDSPYLTTFVLTGALLCIGAQSAAMLYAGGNRHGTVGAVWFLSPALLVYGALSFVVLPWLWAIGIMSASAATAAILWSFPRSIARGVTAVAPI